MIPTSARTSVLFAVVLSVYLWDINTQVAMPVVIIAALTTLFYAVTVSLRLFFQLCPYRTALLGLLVFT